MTPPKIDNAPGITWRPRVRGRWVASWQARTDLVARGYEPKSVRLWSGTELSDTDRQFLSDRCNQLQSAMLVWGRGAPVMATTFDGSLKGLINCYQTDKDSPYRDLRYHTRVGYDYKLARIVKDCPDITLPEINARKIKEWHSAWSADGRVALGHTLVTMLRILCNFGSTILEDPECERLARILHGLRFKQGDPRREIINAEQATALRATAHRMGFPSIALAQAFQFEGTLRQKDVIGEWVPISEPGMSLTTSGNAKWLRGLRWEEIDGNLILRHVTSKRGKEIVIDLKNAPMVLEELAKIEGELPSSGPVIVAENTGLPFVVYEFRRIWRNIANKAGIPKEVKNMDSRAGAITEATDSGAALEDVRHAATHSNISMTARYSRGAEQKVAGVMQQRTAHRNKTRT